MTAPASPHRARLALLVRYLREDPGNPQLLADACDTALHAGMFEQALECLTAAQRQGLAGPAWTWRRARLALARRELEQAGALLEALCAASTAPALAFIHDLAWVRMLQGDLQACRTLLAPHAQACGGSDEAAQAVQVLWLRALHRQQALQEAWDWSVQMRGRHALAARAEGVAALIAVDLGDFGAAQSCADAALAVDGQQVEALVARGTVALALGQSAQALQWLARALECQPEDGRILSAMGFAHLQARDFGAAEQHLQRALRSVPRHVGSWHALGWARLLQGQRGGAREAFAAALDVDRNFAETHGALGLVLALQGEGARADHHLDTADRLDRGNVTARYARAVLAGEANDGRQLRALAQRLLDRPGLFGGRLRDDVHAATP